MSKLTSAVGIVLIAAAGAIVAVSSSHEDVLKANKTLCAKYTKDAETAIASKDFKKALKLAKLAIKVDPSNKSGYKVLTKIADAQHAGTAPATNTATPAKGATATEKATTPAKSTTPTKKPAPAEEEEEMGC